MFPKSRADKSQRSNLQKGKKVISMIVLRDVPHTIPRIQLAMNCQRFMNDPILLSSSYVVQSDASPDVFAHFMEGLDSSEAQFSPQIADDLISLAREFGHNGLISSFGLHQGVPSRQENVHDLLQELNKGIRGATFDADLRSIRGSLTDMRRDISVIKGAFDGDLRRIESELEKMV
jgi:hypothetical protein